MPRYQRGLLPSTEADLQKGGWEIIHPWQVLFSLMDAVFDCWLCYCAAGNFNEAHDSNLARGNYETIQKLTVVSVFLSVIETGVFINDRNNDEDKNGVYSDLLSLFILWIEDIPKACLNVQFIINYKSVFHWCCFCKLIFVAVRILWRVCGVCYKKKNGRGWSICNCCNLYRACLRRLYSLGLFVEAIFTASSAVIQIYKMSGSVDTV